MYDFLNIRRKKSKPKILILLIDLDHSKEWEGENHPAWNSAVTDSSGISVCWQDAMWYCWWRWWSNQHSGKNLHSEKYILYFIKNIYRQMLSIHSNTKSVCYTTFKLVAWLITGGHFYLLFILLFYFLYKKHLIMKDKIVHNIFNSYMFFPPLNVICLVTIFLQILNVDIYRILNYFTPN